VDPTLLRTFVAVVRLESFSAAARELGYTQSAVSQQVAALESDLGVVLLQRRPVGLTEAGSRLLEHAGPLLLRLNAARSDVARAAGVAPTHLSIGAAPLVDVDHLATIIVHTRQSMPRVSYTVRICGRDAVVSALSSADLDLGVVDGVAAANDPLRLVDTGPFTTVTFAEDAVVVALPVGHPMSGRTALALEDLADAGWLDAPDIATPLSQLCSLARTDGFRASFSYDGTDVRALLSLASAGAGLVLLPRSAVRQRPDLVAVALSTPRLVHRTELVHGRLTGPAAELAAALRG
jgi:DNA-binding transcriptional LysR family regulator